MPRLSLLLAAGPLLLAGCTVGPDYVKPSAEVTPAYKEQPLTGDKIDAAGSWTPAHPSDAALRSNWWEAFGDTELDALEEQVGTANQDLKAADARFRSVSHAPMNSRPSASAPTSRR